MFAPKNQSRRSELSWASVYLRILGDDKCSPAEVLTMARYLLLLFCPECQTLFYLCSSCFTGQRYCSPQCRRKARQRSVVAARQRYARSDKGHETNRARQERLREARRQKIPPQEKSVTDQGSPVRAISDTHHATSQGSPERTPVNSPLSSTLHCRCCGFPSQFVMPLHDWLALKRRSRASRAVHRKGDRYDTTRSGKKGSLSSSA